MQDKDDILTSIIQKARCLNNGSLKFHKEGAKKINILILKVGRYLVTGKKET